jgi:hypothetical protein
MQRRRLRFASASLGAVAAALVASVVVAADGAKPASSSLQPVIPKAVKGERCVEDTAVMRRHHMRMLEHQRDATVHGGIRGAKHSLKGCIDCHASPDTKSVAAGPKDFCVACHAYAAVKIDCFDCHTGKAAASKTATGDDTSSLIAALRGASGALRDPNSALPGATAAPEGARR